jgi:hypothetical protein
MLEKNAAELRNGEVSADDSNEDVFPKVTLRHTPLDLHVV